MFSKKIIFYIKNFEKLKEPLTLKDLIPEETLSEFKQKFQIKEQELTEGSNRNTVQDDYRSLIRKKVSKGLNNFTLLFNNINSIEASKTSAKPLINYNEMDRLCFMWITQVRKRYTNTSFLKFFNSSDGSNL